MPDAFSIGPLLVRTLPFSVILSLFVAIGLATRLAKYADLEERWTSKVAEGSAWLGLLGARLGFVALNWQAYRDTPWTALYVWQPGYMPVAGLIVGAAYAIWRLQQRGLAERTRYLGALGGGYALAAVLLGGIIAAMNLYTDPDELQIGDFVPDFTLQTLEGKNVSFSSLEGQAVVLNFWATWCPPCRREMPLLDAIHKEYGPRGLSIVGVDVNEPAATVRAYIESVGVSYPVWVDAPKFAANVDRTQAVYARFGGVGLPTTIFIDPEGIVRDRQIGELNRAILQNRIESILPRY